MSIPRYYFVRLAYIAIDLFSAALAIFLACLFRASTLPFSPTPLTVFAGEGNPFHFIFLFWIIVVILINNNHDLYQTRRELLETREVWDVIRSVGLSALVTIVLIFILKVPGFPRALLALTALLMAMFFSAWRVLKRILVNYLVCQGYNNFNTLVIGAGKVGDALYTEIKRRPEMGIRVVGFLDDLKEKTDQNNPLPILGAIKDFSRVARREFINKVFITIHHDHDVFIRLLEQAKALGIAVRVVPQGFDLTTGQFSKYNIGFIPILEYSDAQQFQRQAGKRIFDILCSLGLLVLLAPVFLVIALLIKMDNPGPVFFRSRRFGRGGRIFTMLKFRSMVTHAEQIQKDLCQQNEADGPIFKIKNDPRITPLGRWLRKYSLDELPQFLNVLWGDMSLVGPRPLPTEQIEKEDLKQLKRLEVRPGITGLWQIRGRSDISFARLVKWDIWYINNWSFWLDWNILLQTVPVVLKGRGAY